MLVWSRHPRFQSEYLDKKYSLSAHAKGSQHRSGRRAQDLYRDQLRVKIAHLRRSRMDRKISSPLFLSRSRFLYQSQSAEWMSPRLRICIEIVHQSRPNWCDTERYCRK